MNCICMLVTRNPIEISTYFDVSFWIWWFEKNHQEILYFGGFQESKVYTLMCHFWTLCIWVWFLCLKYYFFILDMCIFSCSRLGKCVSRVKKVTYTKELDAWMKINFVNKMLRLIIFFILYWFGPFRLGMLFVACFGTHTYKLESLDLITFVFGLKKHQVQILKLFS